LAAALGGGGLFHFGEDVDVSAWLQDGREGRGCGPPWCLLV
jgi:hypothetical protein